MLLPRFYSKNRLARWLDRPSHICTVYMSVCFSVCVFAFVCLSACLPHLTSNFIFLPQRGSNHPSI